MGSRQTWFQQASSVIGNSLSGITNGSSERQPYGNKGPSVFTKMSEGKKGSPYGNDGPSSVERLALWTSNIASRAAQASKKIVHVAASEVGTHGPRNFAQISGHESHVADLPIVLCEKGVRLPGPTQVEGIPSKYKEYYDYDPITGTYHKKP